MPISKKIILEIEKLDAAEKEKELLQRILELEDGGLRNYTSPYEKEINSFIESEEGENSERNCN